MGNPDNENSLRALATGDYSAVVELETDGIQALPSLVGLLEEQNQLSVLSRLLEKGELGGVVSGLSPRPTVEDVAQTIIDLADLRQYQPGRHPAMTLRAIAVQTGVNIAGIEDTGGYTLDLIKALGDRRENYFPIK